MLWCFQENHPRTYFPFPGAEKFVPPGRKRKKLVFPWGNFAQRHTQFLGAGAGPLKGTVEKVYYHSISPDEKLEKCVFEMIPHHQTLSEHLFVYTVRNVDYSNSLLTISDVYLTTRIEDFQRAFPELNLKYSS